MEIASHRTKRKERIETVDAAGIERAVRQQLADKVNGNLLGLWLLIPEHLRLGTWEMIRSWTGASVGSIDARLALQLIHESALCSNGVRERRTLSQRGFELLNGLTFVATDSAIHRLLDAHSVSEAQQLQIFLGTTRKSLGHYKGDVLAIDPHRLASCTKRQMLHLRKDEKKPPAKMAQTFFCLDAQTHQPICFTSASAAQSVSRATPALLELSEHILGPLAHHPLVMADTEHHTVQLQQWAASSCFDLLVPMPMTQATIGSLRALPPECFKEQWPGYATVQRAFSFKSQPTGVYAQFIQRTGQTPEEWRFKSFLCTRERDEVDALTAHYPKRWHIEQFFDNDQALGWQRAGTMNQNIQYGRMTLSLFAQAASSMFKAKLPPPLQTWDASHLAQDFFRAVEGDVRVVNDTIVVTLYNCPNAEHFKEHYENIPDKLEAQGINPSVPWLYDLKIDFRFK